MSRHDAGDIRTEFAKAFETTTDPLKAYEPTFRTIEADPFDLFIADSLLAGDISDPTVAQYRIAYRQWKEYMRDAGRHPACPNDAHVRGFAHWLQVERDNGAVETIKQKLHKLNRAYRFWQREPTLPHTHRYDPFALGREKIEWHAFEDTGDKSPPYISRDELRAVLGTISDLRDLVPIVTQLKLGLRVGELRNVQLREVNLQQSDVKAQYPSLGTHEEVRDRPNAIYVPGRDERDGNKSTNARVLPLDSELQRSFTCYLRVRPTWIDTWLFLSKEEGQMDMKAVNEAWKDAFHPEYAESDSHRAVTSHFGRHYFTSYWRKERDLSRELVQYMRGDRLGNPQHADSWMHHYLHVYYEDIEDRFRREIFDLGLRIGDS